MLALAISTVERSFSVETTFPPWTVRLGVIASDSVNVTEMVSVPALTAAKTP